MNLECLVAHMTKFCVLVLTVFSIVAVFFLMYKNKYQLTCTKQKVPHNSDVPRSLKSFWSLVQNLRHVTLLAPRMWRWFLDSWKICGLLSYAMIWSCTCTLIRPVLLNLRQ